MLVGTPVKIYTSKSIPTLHIGATIRTHWEIQCLPHTGFFTKKSNTKFLTYYDSVSRSALATPGLLYWGQAQSFWGQIMSYWDKLSHVWDKDTYGNIDDKYSHIEKTDSYIWDKYSCNGDKHVFCYWNYSIIRDKYIHKYIHKGDNTLLLGTPGEFT